MKVLMPQIGMTMTEGTIVEWKAADGDRVTEGEPLLEIETEKLNNEIDAPATGILKILAEEGEDVDCGVEIAEIIED